MTDEIEDMDVDKSDIPKMVSFHHILWRVCRRTVLFSIDTQCENIDENLQQACIFFVFTTLFVVFYVFASVYWSQARVFFILLQKTCAIYFSSKMTEVDLYVFKKLFGSLRVNIILKIGLNLSGQLVSRKGTIFIAPRGYK